MYRHYKDTENNVYAYDETQTPAEGLTAISEQEKDELLNQAQAAIFERMSYKERRRTEYPPIFDYIDGVVKSDQAQIDAYVAACLAVKAKYPKE
jgi:hypothetical protein